MARSSRQHNIPTQTLTHCISSPFRIHPILHGWHPLCLIETASAGFRMILNGSELAMQVDEKIDLCGIIAPCSFMLCKSTLASMKPGAILEVHLSDPETLEDLLIILNRSGEKIITRVQHGNRTCLWVQRGLSAPSPWPGE